jgi:hypothetical protein
LGRWSRGIVRHRASLFSISRFCFIHQREFPYGWYHHSGCSQSYRRADSFSPRLYPRRHKFFGGCDVSPHKPQGLQCRLRVRCNALLTDYPLGVFRVYSFKAHGILDCGVAAASAAMPKMTGISDSPEAKYFRIQGAAETGVVAMTDYDDDTGARYHRSSRKKPRWFARGAADGSNSRRSKGPA